MTKKEKNRQSVNILIQNQNSDLRAIQYPRQIQKVKTPYPLQIPKVKTENDMIQNQQNNYQGGNSLPRLIQHQEQYDSLSNLYQHEQKNYIQKSHDFYTQQKNTQHGDETPFSFLESLDSLDKLRLGQKIEVKNLIQQSLKNKQKQKKKSSFNGELILRFDFIDKIRPNWYEFILNYSIFQMDEAQGIFTDTKQLFPPTDRRSKIVIVEKNNMNLFIMSKFKDVQQYEDTYLYIEIHGTDKKSNQEQRFWTIFPLFNQYNALHQGQFKLPFYKFDFHPKLLVERSIPNAGPMAIYIRIGVPENKAMNTDKIQQMQLYNLIDLFNIQRQNQQSLSMVQQDYYGGRSNHEQQKQNFARQYMDENASQIRDQIEQEYQRINQYQQKLAEKPAFLKPKQVKLNQSNHYNYVELSTQIQLTETPNIQFSSKITINESQLKKNLKPQNWPIRITQEEIEEFRKQKYKKQQ